MASEDAGFAHTDEILADTAASHKLPNLLHIYISTRISHFQIAICLQDPPLGSQESPSFHTPQAELPALPPLVFLPQWPPHHREWQLLSGPQAKSSTVPFDTCLCYTPINQDILWALPDPLHCLNGRHSSLSPRSPHLSPRLF